MKILYIIFIIIFFNIYNSFSESVDNNKNDIKKYNSIMFTNKNLEDIEKMIPFLKLNLNKKNTSTNVNKTENNGEFQNNSLLGEDDTNIFLNSIMYFSKDNWAIWINGKKITNLTKNDNNDIEIISVQPLYVNFYWKINSKKWEIINISNQISSDKYKIEDNEIKLNLKLNPNQTYISLEDKIVEGNFLRIENINEDDNIEGNNTKNNNQSEINEDNIFF